ncbi:unnamed protein product [Rotaria sp. Silwood2]|nr:unnamed protein product [Rotaria sp. Silwood2]
MSIIQICLLLLILSVSVIDGRALRKRRQAPENTFRQDLGNFVSSGYNLIRNNLVPSISSTANQFSQNFDRYRQGFYQGVNQIGQNWDRYKQNLNQGVNQFNQGWNQFKQNFVPQYPYNNNNYDNYAYNQYGYNSQQNPYPMNYNYNAPPNMYRTYDGRPQNPYVGNNYVHWRGSPGANTPYYSGNVGGQFYQNFGGQQRSNGPIASNSDMYANQIPGPRRR